MSRANAGGTVAHEITTAPGRRCATIPPSSRPCPPNSTASVCAAFSTTETTASSEPATSAASPASPPSARSRSTASGFRSTPWTRCPARRSEPAMPKPMEPRPKRATFEGVSTWRFTEIRRGRRPPYGERSRRRDPDGVETPRGSIVGSRNGLGRTDPDARRARDRSGRWRRPRPVALWIRATGAAAYRVRCGPGRRSASLSGRPPRPRRPAWHRRRRSRSSPPRRRRCGR